MKPLLFILIFLMVFISLLEAQDSSKIDSLKNELEQSSGIVKIDILIKLSDFFRTSDPFSSYSYAKEALRLSTLHKHPQGQVQAHGNIGAFYRYNAQYSKALENHFLANELIEEVEGNSLLLIRNNNLLGEVYRAIKEFDKAIEYYEIARELSEKSGELESLIVARENIGLTYIEKGEFQKALDMSKRSLELSQNRNYLFGTMISLYNLGVVNHHIREFEGALDYFHRLEVMVEQYGDQIGAEFTLGKIKLFQSMAETFYALNRLEAAEEYALRSWNIASNSRYKADFKMANDFLYEYNIHLGNHEEALKYFRLSYELNDEIKSEVNNRQLLLLESLEEDRKMEIAMKLEQERKDRKFRLEYIGISFGILIIFLLALIFGRFTVARQIGKGILFLSFLFLFEFVLLLMDPPLEIHTSGEPIFKMLANSIWAIAFTFLHRLFERKVSIN